jgi:hypothetical protein
LEIIFELIFSFFGYALQLFFEIFAQAAFELLAELGVRCLAEPFKRPNPSSPIMAATGYLVYGATAGAASLLLPKMFVVSNALRLTNLIVTPIVCGYVMAWFGRFRERRGDDTIRLDTFMYGYLFALSMAVVRYIWR